MFISGSESIFSLSSEDCRLLLPGSAETRKMSCQSRVEQTSIVQSRSSRSRVQQSSWREAWPQGWPAPDLFYSHAVFTAVLYDNWAVVHWIKHPSLHPKLEILVVTESAKTTISWHTKGLITDLPLPSESESRGYWLHWSSHLFPKSESFFQLGNSHHWISHTIQQSFYLPLTRITDG